MDDNFNDLQRLLRLKRHEAPPPEFFEDFMAEFHQRQRAELLRRPIWRLVLDRMEGAWPVFPVARYAYAGSCAIALFAAGLTSVRILSAPVAGPTLAKAGTPPELVDAPAPAPIAPPPKGFNTQYAYASPTRFDFRAPHQSFAISSDLDFDNPRSATVPAVASYPRYVLDAQPVSYEQPLTF